MDILYDISVAAEPQSFFYLQSFFQAPPVHFRCSAAVLCHPAMVHTNEGEQTL